MLRIRVSLLPGLEPVADDVEIAVVIDVLRATSAITTAFHNGARRVWTVTTVEQATRLQSQLQDTAVTRVLLCGERNCRPIHGFDLGNSPAEYTRDVVDGRELIFTTTNGTLAAESARPAKRIWLGSFLNRSAIVDALIETRRRRGPDSTGRVHFVCAGTEGRISREDALLAGCFVDALSSRHTVDLENDQTRIALAAFREAIGDADDIDGKTLTEELAVSLGGANLLAAGYEKDLTLCAAVDRCNWIPKRETAASFEHDRRIEHLAFV